MNVELPTLGSELVCVGLGPFDLIEFLGTGRFAETYRVMRGGDEYALKVCHFLPRMPQQLWERELEALRRVRHPNVMGFRRAGHFQAGGKVHPYMECEYIKGGDAKQRIAAGSRPEDQTTLRAFFAGLLRGVAELHDLGILHRDIRPANVALRGGDWRSPVLLDFGLAQALLVSAAQQRLTVADRRRDLVAVAEVVYEAGTGWPPSPDCAGSRWMAAHRRRGPLRDPREISAFFADDVAELILRVLSGGRLRLGADEALRLLGAT